MKIFHRLSSGQSLFFVTIYLIFVNSIMIIDISVDLSVSLRSCRSFDLLADRVARSSTSNASPPPDEPISNLGSFYERQLLYIHFCHTVCNVCMFVCIVSHFTNYKGGGALLQVRGTNFVAGVFGTLN